MLFVGAAGSSTCRCRDTTGLMLVLLGRCCIRGRWCFVNLRTLLLLHNVSLAVHYRIATSSLDMYLSTTTRVAGQGFSQPGT